MLSLIHISSLEASIQLLEPVIQRSVNGLFPARWLALRLLEEDASLEAGLQDYLGYDLKEEPSVRQALKEAHAVLNTSSLSDTIAESILSQAEKLASSTVQADPDKALSLIHI